MASKKETQSLILRYWQSWQKHDWEEMRRCLADEIVFGGQAMPAEQIVIMSQNGTPWRDVNMLASHYSENEGAIMYEGTDTKNGNVIRVAEFISIDDGKIKSSNACFGSGIPPV